MMGALNDLEHFLGTNEGKIAAWLVFLMIFAVIFQSGMVCNAQIDKIITSIPECPCAHKVPINNTLGNGGFNVSGTG